MLHINGSFPSKISITDGTGFRLQAAWPSEFRIEIWNWPIGRSIQSWCALLADWSIFRHITTWFLWGNLQLDHQLLEFEHCDFCDVCGPSTETFLGWIATGKIGVDPRSPLASQHGAPVIYENRCRLRRVGTWGKFVTRWRSWASDHEILFLDQTSGYKINTLIYYGAKVYSRSLSDSKFVRMCSERSQGDVREQKLMQRLCRGEKKGKVRVLWIICSRQWFKTPPHHDHGDFSLQLNSYR